MNKGLSFDQLYPGTYIKAGEFNGKPVTLTIKSVKREMLSNGTGGEEGAVTVSFAETEKQFVMNKTCGVCLRAMWGDDSGDWVGHRITLHPVRDESGLSESGQCIRVLGSPELDKPLKFRARLGRKMVTQTLVPTKKGGGNPPAPAADPVTGEVDDDDADYWPEDPAPATEPALSGDSVPSEGPEPYEPSSAAEDEDDDGPVPGRGPRSAAEYGREVAERANERAAAENPRTWERPTPDQGTLA